MKIAYLYDELERFFIREITAQIDPLESALKNQNIYLLPANSTFIEPLPEKKGYARIFNGKEWKYKIDHRNKKIINANGIQTVKYVGPLKKGDVLLTEEIEQQLMNGDIFYNNGKLVPPTTEQLAEKKRLERNILLNETDKYILSDYEILPEDREKYIAYRKYLKDITKDENFPNIEIKRFEQWIG